MIIKVQGNRLLCFSHVMLVIDFIVNKLCIFFMYCSLYLCILYIYVGHIWEIINKTPLCDTKQDQSEMATYARRPPLEIVMHIYNELRCWFSISPVDMSQYHVCPRFEWFRVIAYTVDKRTARYHNTYCLNKRLSYYREQYHNDAIMSLMASQITILAIVYSTVYSGTVKENIKAPRHWPLCGEFTGEFPAQRASKVENVSIGWRHEG